MNDVTFLIKTFERPDCLQRLVASIKRRYEMARILVVDDSRKPTFLPGVQTLTLPYDSGISAGRNEGLRHIETPYFVLLDDDYEFMALTKIGLLRQALIRHSLDLVGGSYFRWHESAWEVFDQRNHLGTEELIYSVNRYQRGTLSPLVVKCDWTINFFLAKTEKIRSIGGWNERLKVQEHAEFFVNCLGKAKIASMPCVQVIHHANKQLNSEHYRSMRFRPEYNDIRNEEIKKDFGVFTRRRSPKVQNLVPLRVFYNHLRHGTKGSDSPLVTPQVRQPLLPIESTPPLKAAGR